MTVAGTTGLQTLAKRVVHPWIVQKSGALSEFRKSRRSLYSIHQSVHL